MTENKYQLPLSKLYPEIASLEEMEEKVTAEIARRKDRRRLIRADLKAYREAVALLEKRGAPQADYTPAEGEDAKAWKLGDSEPVPRPAVEEDAPFRHRKELARGTEVYIDDPGTPHHGRHGRVQHDPGNLIWVLLDGAESGVGFRPDHVKVVVPGWRPQVGDKVRVTQEGVWLGHHGRITGLPADDRGLWPVRLDDVQDARSLWTIDSLALVEHADLSSAISATTE
jgi:hypothetical protein